MIASNAKDRETRKMLEAVMPVPPSSNNAYVNIDPRSGKGGGRVLSTKARQWKKLAVGLLLQAVQEQKKRGAKGYPIKHCIVTITMNIDYRSDVSNRVKLLHDALENGGIIVDDRYIEMQVALRSHEFRSIVDHEIHPLKADHACIQVLMEPAPDTPVDTTVH